MFLDMTLKRNPQLIEAAVKLHRDGAINPNTYVLDIDMIKQNTVKIVQEAQKLNIKLYMMTKQLGRNPEVAKIIAKCGIEKAVTVDPWEAVSLAKAGIKLGHVGHLVQIPTNMIKEILSYCPEVVTIFSVQKAMEISREAQAFGTRQDILLKIMGSDDTAFEGQKGGFRESDLLEAAKKITEMPGVKIVGLTSFPCFLYDNEKEDVVYTENAFALVRCVEKLEKELKIKISHINAPSANSVYSFSMMAALGATHGEPGHALSGTTPLHGNREQPEIPSIVYVSEISHCNDDKAYVYGGGFYARSGVKRAMVGKDFEEMKINILEAEKIPPDFIDYYGTLDTAGCNVNVGDTVIYAFRTQIFVTRSEVALVEGIHDGKPRITGIYDSSGTKLK